MSRSLFEGLFFASEKEFLGNFVDDPLVTERWSGFCRAIDSEVDGNSSRIMLTTVDGGVREIHLMDAVYELTTPGLMSWKTSWWDSEVEVGGNTVVSVRPAWEPADSKLLLGADFALERNLLERIHELRSVNGAYRMGQGPQLEDVVLRAITAEFPSRDSACVGLALYWQMPDSEHEVFLSRRVNQKWNSSRFGPRWIDRCEAEGFVEPKALENLSRTDISASGARFVIRMFDSGLQLSKSLLSFVGRSQDDLVDATGLPELVPPILRLSIGVSNEDLGWFEGAWDKDRVSVAKGLLASKKLFAPIGEILSAADVGLRHFEAVAPPVSLALLSQPGVIVALREPRAWDELEVTLAERLIVPPGAEHVEVVMTSSQCSDLWMEGHPEDWILSFSWRPTAEDPSLSFDLSPAEGGCDGNCRRYKEHVTFCIPFEADLQDFLGVAVQQDELDRRGWELWERPLNSGQSEPEIISRLMLGVARWGLQWEPNIEIKVVT